MTAACQGRLITQDTAFFAPRAKLVNRMPKGVWFLRQQELKDLQVLKNTQTYFGKTNKCMYMRTGDVIFLF